NPSAARTASRCHSRKASTAAGGTRCTTTAEDRDACRSRLGLFAVAIGAPRPIGYFRKIDHFSWRQDDRVAGVGRPTRAFDVAPGSGVDPARGSLANPGHPTGPTPASRSDSGAGLLVRATAGDPGLVDVAVVAADHDPEEELRRLVHGLGSLAAGDERLVPAHGRLAGVPVERDEVGLLPLVEVAEHVVEVEGPGAAERGQVVAAIGVDLAPLGLGHVLFAGVDRAVEHRVVAHADLVGLLQHADEAEGVAAAHVAAERDPDRVLGGGGAADPEQAAAEEQVRERAERDRGAGLREPAELVLREPDAVAGRELRPEQPVLLVDVGVVVAVGELEPGRPQLGRVLRDVGVDPAVGVFFLELPAGLHHLVGAADGEPGCDCVEVPALAVVLLDQPLGLAVEVLRADDRVGGGET